jgi:hypothetical protein
MVIINFMEFALTKMKFGSVATLFNSYCYRNMTTTSV